MRSLPPHKLSLVPAITFSLTKKKERDADWQRYKFELYKELVQSLSRIVSVDSSPEGNKRFASACNTLHLIGSYARAYKKLKASGFQLQWQSAPESRGQAKAKKASKTKYTCPDRGQNAWAKPDAALICGECYDEDEGTVTMMQAEEEAVV